MAFVVGFFPSVGLGLSVERSGQAVTVGGDHFKIGVDAARGGELSRVDLFDGARWNTFLAAPAVTFPRINLADPQGEYALANDREGKLLNVMESPDKVVIKTQGVPRDKDGRASPWQVSFEYEVYPEGAVFIDVTYDLKDGTFAMVRSTVCLEAGENIRKGPTFADQNLCSSIGGFRSARMAFGSYPDKSYTNEIEVVVENMRPMIGEVRYESKRGESVWTLGGGGTEIKGPWSYRNRLAMGLGAVRSGKPKTNAIGHRVFHWVNWIDTENWYPTNVQIDRMVALNMTMLVLHHEWMKQRGSNGNPHADYSVVRNEEEMRRTIQYAHEKGVRVGLYMRGVERYGLDTGFFQKYCRRDWDGIYVDWHGHAGVSWHEKRYQPNTALGDTHTSTDGTCVPAREYFLFTKKLRQTVGPKGFLIGHQGSFNCGILSNLVFDAYLPGETGSDHAMFADRDKAVHKGMVGGVPCMPWTLDSTTFRSPEGAAKMAAWGFYPHIVLGLKPPRSKELFPLDPDDPKYTAIYPYWRVLAAANVEAMAVHNLPSQGVRAMTSSEPDVQGVVYTAGEGTYLVVVANLGEATTSAKLALNARALGMEGTYHVQRIDSSTGKAEPLGTSAGELVTSHLPPWGIEGFRLSK